MSMVSLLVNVLHVTVIVGIVAASKSHHCFGVNVEAAVHEYSCYRVLPGMACLFPITHLTEMVSIQQLASLCGCGINIVSSLGSLGHAKVVKVTTYLCGCQVD